MKLVLLSLFTGCLLLFLYNLITVLQLPQSSKSSCGDLQSPRCHFFVARERHVIFLPRKTCYVSIFSFLRLLCDICIKIFIPLLLQTQHIYTAHFLELILLDWLKTPWKPHCLIALIFCECRSEYCQISLWISVWFSNKYRWPDGVTSLII